MHPSFEEQPKRNVVQVFIVLVMGSEFLVLLAAMEKHQIWVHTTVLIFAPWDITVSLAPSFQHLALRVDMERLRDCPTHSVLVSVMPAIGVLTRLLPPKKRRVYLDDMVPNWA
jgi:hypothetical protein